MRKEIYGDQHPLTEVVFSNLKEVEQKIRKRKARTVNFALLSKKNRRK